MDKDDKRRQRPIIIERHAFNKPTSEARGALYEVIVLFRKLEESADDTSTRDVFSRATETLIGLVKDFRQHEEQPKQDDGDIGRDV